MKRRPLMVCLAMTTLTCPAFAQPGHFDVPDSVWPDELQWRSLGDSARIASTRFGEISVSQTGGGETGRPRTTQVTLDTETTQMDFAGNSSIVRILDVVQMDDRDIVFFIAVEGGSGSPPGTLNLLPITSDGMGQMIADPGLRSIDGFVRIAVTRDHIYFDLGFHDGLRRSAKWSADGLEIELFAVDVNSLPAEDCWRLYSTVGTLDCRVNHRFSLATQRWLSSLDHHPIFEQDVIYQMCADTGEDRSVPLYEDFEAQVCSVGR